MNADLSSRLTLTLPRKCCLPFTSATYIHMNFRLDFIMEANTMNYDQTASNENNLVLVHIVDSICYLNISRRDSGRQKS